MLNYKFLNNFPGVAIRPWGKHHHFLKSNQIPEKSMVTTSGSLPESLKRTGTALSLTDKVGIWFQIFTVYEDMEYDHDSPLKELKT